MKGRVLVVDDEPAVRAAIQRFLEGQGFGAAVAEDCRSAEAAFVATRPDAAIIDYSLPDGNALELLPRLKAIDPSVPLVILTGFGSIDLAVRAIKEGADQFLTKPVELPTLSVLLERLVAAARDRRRKVAGSLSKSREAIDPFLGQSPELRRMAELARRVADSDAPLLIYGETGAGKGVLARWIHEHGPRAEEALVDVNCAGLSREFLETELFGHEKGAFTGAVSAKEGLLEVADRGTVFLDEVGDVEPSVQPKLLKVIEERRFRRLGGVQDRNVDIRLIAATHHDLGRLVSEGRFRSDLYFRLGTISMTVPALRQRGEDILVIARHVLSGLAGARGRGEMRLSREAEGALLRYAWPGNVRELRNILERAVLLCDEATVEVEDLGIGAAPRRTVEPSDVSLSLAEVERRHIEAVLADTHGRIDPAARRLGIHRSSLYNKIKRHRIPVSRS
jgi:DNA-binding NtrC family response regulator